MKRMIDPPEGWRYGFPKELPEDCGDIRTWFLNNGYPERKIELALKHSTMWLEDENETVQTDEE